VFSFIPLKQIHTNRKNRMRINKTRRKKLK
jgi:hypothetical protein